MMGVRWVTGFLDTPSAVASQTASQDGSWMASPVASREASQVAESFWQAVTGSRLSARRGPGGRFATLVPADGDAYLRVQVVGDGPARAHLDLHVEDVPPQARRAVGLGAAVVLDEGDLVVLRSPAGLLFCLVAWHGEAVRPAGRRSLVDQMCLDLPAGGFDAEADFWAALTGWRRRPGSLPEFDFLVRPDGMPLRLLLQRVDATAGMHLDLACADRAAEVAWHVSLGATVVAVYERWTTLRDPAGRSYCVTDRPM